MPESLAARIEELLASAEQSLTSAQIAEQLETPPEEVDHVVWEQPQTFAWQPGHRWALNAPKRAATSAKALGEQSDARGVSLLPKEAVELRAITLNSGVTLRVTKRPIDSASLFTVESRGGELLLVLNSSHPVFVQHPMPFADDDADCRGLLELLLEAWALHEDGVPSGATKRSLQETRLMWGRRIAQLLVEGQ